MNVLGRTSLIGAYVCPRGVFTIECLADGASIAVERRFEVSVQVEDAMSAADQVVRALRSAGITKADVAIVIRGFGVAHHVLQLPPAKDELLTPIVEREVRRLEPDLGVAAVAWIPLPPMESSALEGPPQQRSLLTAAVPEVVVQAIQKRLEAAGYRLLHLTALPAAMQRLQEEFDGGTESLALVAPLPDGAFIGFSLNGGLRLIVEPPPVQNEESESAALAEEVELGAMFVRQQFRGSPIDRVTLIGSKVSLADAEETLAGRLHVPAGRLDVKDLSPAALAALGAVLDARSLRPLTLGGRTRTRAQDRAKTALESVAIALVLIVALLGAWVTFEGARGKRASNALLAAHRRIEQEAFGLGPVRSTAEQRRMVREAVGALRLVASDRTDLQRALSGIASVVRAPLRIDSLRLVRAPSGWLGSMAGSVTGSTNARAVESLHDLYRELPQRLSLDSLRLDQLRYSDVEDAGPAMVRFQLSFGIPSGRKD